MALRVLHILLEPRMGGPQLRILTLARALRTHDIETAVLLPEGPAPFRTYLEREGFAVAQVPLSRPRAHPSYLLETIFSTKMVDELDRLVGFLRRNAPDVVHVHGLSQPIGAWAARLAGIPLVWHLNDLVLPRPLARLAAPMVSHLAGAVICVSEAVRHYVFEGTPPSHAVVCYDPPAREGGEDAGTQDSSSIGEGADSVPQVICLGNLNRLKGHVDLLKATALIRVPVKVQVFGARLETQPQIFERLMALRTALRQEGRFELGGWTDDVVPLLQRAALYVHPSYSEACPLAVLEAMAAGRAVVATAVGGVPELVVEGETGLLVPPARPAELARAIESLLQRPDRCREMGEAGRARVAARFSVARAAWRHAVVYERVARRRKVSEDALLPGAWAPAGSC